MTNFWRHVSGAIMQGRTSAIVPSMTWPVGIHSSQLWLIMLTVRQATGLIPQLSQDATPRLLVVTHFVPIDTWIHCAASVITHHPSKGLNLVPGVQSGTNSSLAELWTTRYHPTRHPTPPHTSPVSHLKVTTRCRSG